MPVADQMDSWHAVILKRRPQGQILLSTLDPKGIMARSCDERLSYQERIRPNLLQSVKV